MVSSDGGNLSRPNFGWYNAKICEKCDNLPEMSAAVFIIIFLVHWRFCQRAKVSLASSSTPPSKAQCKAQCTPSHTLFPDTCCHDTKTHISTLVSGVSNLPLDWMQVTSPVLSSWLWSSSDAPPRCPAASHILLVHSSIGKTKHLAWKESFQKLNREIWEHFDLFSKPCCDYAFYDMYSIVEKVLERQRQLLTVITYMYNVQMICDTITKFSSVLSFFLHG